MNTVIILFILIANIVAILLTYYSFSKDFEKSKKLFYTMISMGSNLYNNIDCVLIEHNRNSKRSSEKL